MKLQELLLCLSERTNVALFDGFEYVCTACPNSPVWEPYVNRTVIKIDICTPANYEKDPLAAHIVVTLDIDISEDDGMYKESED